LILFNNLIAPGLAVMAVSTNCFYNVFIPPNVVNTEYSFIPTTSCVTIQGDLFILLDCTSPIQTTFGTSYLPPFEYNYQCSTSLVTNYAVFYVILFTMNTIINPIAIIFIDLIKLNNKYPSLNKYLPKLLRPLDNLMTSSNQVTLMRPIFHRDFFVIRIINQLAVLVTYGAIFPPLAPIICLTVCSYTFTTQIMIGRLHYLASNDAMYHEIQLRLERDCKGTIVLLSRCLWIITPYASLVYALFVNDIFGSSVGYELGILSAMIMMIIPTILLVLSQLISKAESKSVLSNSTRIESTSHEIHI